MHALIQKSDNQILRVAPEGPTLAEEKPFYWLQCPDDCTTAWTFDGAAFSAPVIPEPEPETPEQVIARLESAIDRHLDQIANTYRYESIRTMVTYAASQHPTFGPEGRAALAWRDACYQTGLEILAAVQSEQREIPTEEELIEEMPLIADFFE